MSCKNPNGNQKPKIYNGYTQNKETGIQLKKKNNKAQGESKRGRKDQRTTTKTTREDLTKWQ